MLFSSGVARVASESRSNSRSFVELQLLHLALSHSARARGKSLRSLSSRFKRLKVWLRLSTRFAHGAACMVITFDCFLLLFCTVFVSNNSLKQQFTHSSQRVALWQTAHLFVSTVQYFTVVLMRLNCQLPAPLGVHRTSFSAAFCCVFASVKDTRYKSCV